MSEQWGPWVEHDGGPCPCRGATVNAVFRDGDVLIFTAGSIEAPGVASSWEWDTTPPPIHLIRYRLRRPPVLRLLVDIAETLPVRELEDA